MAQQSYFQLISPMIFLVLTAGLFLLYNFEKRLVAAKIFGLSYFFGAAAVTLEFFRADIDPVLAAYLSNIFYNITAILFAVAAAVRYKQKIPVIQIAVVTIALFIGIGYFLHLEPSIASRTIVANSGNGIIFSSLQIASTKEKNCPSTKSSLGSLAFLHSSFSSAQFSRSRFFMRH